MAITYREDTFEGTQLAGENGTVTNLSRGYLVEGIETAGIQALNDAYNAVPLFGSWPNGYPHLRLVKKSAAPVDGSPDKARVVCDYVRLGFDDINFIFTCDGSLTSVQSEKDGAGNPIVLTYTWPEDDPDDDYAGVTQVQGGEVSVQLPSRVLRAKGLIAVDYPIAVQQLWLGAVNAFPWAGGDAGTWLCANCSATPHQLTGVPGENLWSFTFEFQHSMTGWQPTAYFVDERNGKPAPNLVPGESIAQVDWYPQIDYSYYFKDF